MRNLVFVIWMIFYPISCEITDYLVHIVGNKYSDLMDMGFDSLHIVIYTYFGYLLYEKKKP